MSFDDLATRLDELKARHAHRQLVPRAADGLTLIERDGSRLINFGSNDYLGIASEQCRRVGQKRASGSRASALVCGWTDRHQELAERIADFENAESVVLFPSGYSACLGTVSALAGPDDLILSDQLNHASLIDGSRLSKAKRLVFPHRDLGTVEEALAKNRSDYQRVWIVTNTVFGMDGTVAPLIELCDLAGRFGAELIVDEAHATGVLGKTGAGLCEELDVQDRVAVRIGTLSKAIGGQGGFVSGETVLVDFLINHCRSLIFSTSLAPALVEHAIDIFERLPAEQERRQYVRKLASQFRSLLDIEAAELERTIPIIPILMKSDELVIQAAESLRASGFYVPAIRPPTVPEGTSRLRVSLSAAHQLEQVEGLAKVLKTLV